MYIFAALNKLNIVMEVINQILNTTAESFDFSFCITCNALIYIIIKAVDDANGKPPVGEWTKRLITLSVIIIIAIIYVLIHNDYKVVLNSAIITPVFWTWIAKPIIKHLNIDYKH